MNYPYKFHTPSIFKYQVLMLRTGAEHLNICRNDQTMFRKVQSTEISFVKGCGALHLEENTH